MTRVYPIDRRLREDSVSALGMGESDALTLAPTGKKLDAGFCEGLLNGPQGAASGIGFFPLQPCYGIQ